MSKILAIVGAGGFGREVLWAARNGSLYSQKNSSGGGVERFLPTEVIFIDDTKEYWGEYTCGVEIVGGVDETIKKLAKEDVRFICAVGSPETRKALYTKVIGSYVKVKKARPLFVSVVHKNVENSDFVSVGEGTLICAGNIITTQVTVGNFVNLNLDCTVGHDVVIENFVNVSPGVHISGNCTLKEGCDIGTGANILPGVTIGVGAVVGAGACVTVNVPEATTVVGVPAKEIKSEG